MKIRTGFISNSSSSSYIIIYRQIPLAEVENTNWDTVNWKMLGEYLNEGQDYISLTEEYKDIFKFFDRNLTEYQIIEEIKTYDGDGDDFSNPPINKDAKIMSISVDYNCTQNTDDLFDTYFSDEENAKEKYSVEGRYKELLTGDKE